MSIDLFLVDTQVHSYLLSKYKTRAYPFANVLARQKVFSLNIFQEFFNILGNGFIFSAIFYCLLSLLGALKYLGTIINAVKTTVLLNVIEQFEGTIIDEDSKENLETQTHMAGRSYSNDGCKRGRTKMTVAIPAVHECNKEPNVA